MVRFAPKVYKTVVHTKGKTVFRTTSDYDLKRQIKRAQSQGKIGEVYKKRDATTDEIKAHAASQQS